jgi:hypothetical protein
MREFRDHVSRCPQVRNVVFVFSIIHLSCEFLRTCADKEATWSHVCFPLSSSFELCVLLLKVLLMGLSFSRAVLGPRPMRARCLRLCC